LKTLDSRFVLLLLVLVGLAVAGWCYGLHWKRVSLGGAFTPGEKLIVQLQDQIKALTDQNKSLLKQLNSTEAPEEATEAAEKSPPR